jgi:zinc protease
MKINKRFSFFNLICLYAAALLLLAIFISGCSKEEVISFKPAKAKEYRLDNGLRIIINEDHRHPIVALYALVDVGSAREGKYEGSGLTHFIEHMIFKGTPELKTGEFHSKISGLGGETNAYTSFDYTGFYITAPSSAFNKSMTLLSDVIKNSSFEEEEFKKEKKVILREMAMHEDDPASTVIRNLFESAYLRHPYRHPIIGYRDVFNELKRDELYEFYKKAYSPSNIVISVSGDVNASRAYEAIKNAFADFRARPNEIDAGGIIEPRQLAKVENIEYQDVNLGYMALGFKSTSIYSKDLYPLDVLAIALGEGRYSILAKDLKRKKDLVYSISAYNYTPASQGLFIIEADLEAKHFNKAKEETIALLNQIKQKGIKEEDLRRAKKIALSNELNALNTYQAQARDLAYSLMMTNSLEFSSIYIDNIQKVTNQDIKRVAQKYFKEDNLTISAILPEEFASASNSKNTPNAEKSTEIQISKTTLNNGLRILLAEDDTYPLVNIQAIFKGGLRYENMDNNGISQLLAGLITDAKYEGVSVVEQFEKKGGSISAYSQNNSFGIMMQALKPDTDFALKVLDFLINDVDGFPQADVEFYKKLQLADIKAIDDDVFGKNLLMLKKNFFVNHPYALGALGTKDTIKGIQENDLLSFYRGLRRPEDMVIAVFGDIDAHKIADSLRDYFSDLEDPAQSLKQNLPADNHIRERKIINEETDDAQAIVMLAYPAPAAKADDIYAFDVLVTALSGGGSRLFYNLRDVEHLAYSVGAFSMTGFEPGCLIFYLATSPERANEAKETLLKEISVLKESGLHQTEIDKAKQEITGQHTIGLQTASQLGFQAALAELYSKGYNHYKKYPKLIDKVSIEDINAVINKYLNDDNLLILISSKKVPEKISQAPLEQREKGQVKENKDAAYD